MWSSCPWVRTTATTSSSRSAMAVKSGRMRSTPGWLSSGNSTPQSMTSSRPWYSSTAMLRPTSPRPPRAITRRPFSASGGGGPNSGCGWLTGLLRSARSLCCWFARSQQPALGEVGPQLVDLRIARGDQGQSHHSVAQEAEELQRGLRRDGALRAGHDPGHRRDQPGVDLAGGPEVALVDRADHLGVLEAGDMTDDADDADRPVHEPGEVERVVAAVVGQLRRGHHGGTGEEVARGLLDGDDPWMLGEPQEVRRPDPHRGAARDVIDHEREVRGVRDRREVRADPLARRLAVVRRDREEPVRAGLRRLLR